MNENRLSRRRFVSAAGVAALGLPASSLLGGGVAAAEVPTRKFYTVLSLDRIGFEGSFEKSVELALKYGFEGVDPDPRYFARLSDDQLRKLLDDLKAKNLKLGAAGLPVEFRQDEGAFSEGVKNLPAAARLLEKAGVTRVSTWIMPCSDDLTYLQNFRIHACRLRACAQVLRGNGQRLGLEYVAPRTLWRSMRHPFLHTLSELKELLVAVGTDNLGVQLDSFHWFNAEESQDDLLALRSQDVITVDLNDAPNVPLDKQQDGSRELPAATGVIPVKNFLGALLRIGYDGPIQAEPFNAALRALPIEQACAATAAAVKKALGELGIASQKGDPAAAG
jgi:sugar phosphate isomerase/epimerase